MKAIWLFGEKTDLITRNQIIFSKSYSNENRDILKILIQNINSIIDGLALDVIQRKLKGSNYFKLSRDSNVVPDLCELP